MLGFDSEFVRKRAAMWSYFPVLIPHPVQVRTWCTWLEIPSLWSDAICNMCIFQGGWFTPSVNWYESGTYCVHRGLRCFPCHCEVESLNQAVNLWHMSSHLSLFPFPVSRHGQLVKAKCLENNFCSSGFVLHLHIVFVLFCSCPFCAMIQIFVYSQWILTYFVTYFCYNDSSKCSWILLTREVLFLLLT